MIGASPPRFSSINALLEHWATVKGNDQALLFLGADNEERERLTYGELHRASRMLAARLRCEALAGERALLMFEPQLAFVIAFFACHLAGLIPVPVVPVRKGRVRDAALAVAADSQATLLLCSAGQAEVAKRALSEMRAASCIPRVLEVDGCPVAPGTPLNDGVPASAQLAFLQYTSGSTSDPKGVMVSQANLLSNLEMQRLAMQNPWGATYVGWAPLYHDMGLIANVLEPLYLGGLCVLMAPAQMAQSPWLWLRAISRYRAHTSGGSNFAYELCVARARRILEEPLDLSCWKVAFNSAEPVRPDTVQQFRAAFASAGFDGQAMYPCYGLAEATLLVSGGGTHRGPVLKRVSKSRLERGVAVAPSGAEDCRLLVGCGGVVPGGRVAIVDPNSCREMGDGKLGEVWVHGSHIPAAYWNKSEASRATFHASISGDVSRREYLRTGDFGFLCENELYVTGRIKDTLVVRGRNIYPQDLESVARALCGSPREGNAAAFALDGERLALVAEVDRSQRHGFDARETAASVRQAILQEFELTVHDLRFVLQGSIPLTSSGKVRRSETRRRLLAGELVELGAPEISPASACITGEQT